MKNYFKITSFVLAFLLLISACTGGVVSAKAIEDETSRKIKLFERYTRFTLPSSQDEPLTPEQAEVVIWYSSEYYYNELYYHSSNAGTTGDEATTDYILIYTVLGLSLTALTYEVYGIG